MNRLITFEGIDGSGKSTQTKMLREKLEQQHIAYAFVREPGTTRISEKIRDILLNKDHLELFPIPESLLFLAARSQVTSEMILPALEAGKLVICDRYRDSTVCYQGYGRGLDVEALKTLNAFATQQTDPAITFILDISAETSMARRNLQEDDRMESGGSAFMSRVRDGYLTLADSEPDRCRVIDGDRSPEIIFEEIWNIITDVFVDMRS